MSQFKVGDKVISNEYGAGRVIAICNGDEWVNVVFGTDELYYSKSYNINTGERQRPNGRDTITHENVLHVGMHVTSPKKKYIRKSRAMYVKGRRIVSLDDLYRQTFVMWKGKVYNEGWSHGWQIEMAFNAIFSIEGIWVARKKEKNND